MDTLLTDIRYAFRNLISRRIHADRGCHARTWHRRQQLHLQHDQCAPAETSPDARSGSRDDDLGQESQSWRRAQ